MRRGSRFFLSLLSLYNLGSDDARQRNSSLNAVAPESEQQLPPREDDSGEYRVAGKTCCTEKEQFKHL